MWNSTPTEATYKNITLTPDALPDLGTSLGSGEIVASTVLRVSCPKCGLIDKVRADDRARLQHIDRAHAKCTTHG